MPEILRTSEFNPKTTAAREELIKALVKAASKERRESSHEMLKYGVCVPQRMRGADRRRVFLIEHYDSIETLLTRPYPSSFSIDVSVGPALLISPTPRLRPITVRHNRMLCVVLADIYYQTGTLSTALIGWHRLESATRGEAGTSVSVSCPMKPNTASELLGCFATINSSMECI
ncbi:hypothetical protein K402DRAFT_133977 [Aulographum hederae CBS 113979]|uniref:Uncharacterized protein n=1 Tax=Aulographum hederae CBS 113979 TaxID=1176131 RepID=A0A6G1GUS1_9PEZI|nr:hypothetical protein K402DRAFT_133977 [Aulographum hederae CBS 113979]